MALGLVCSYSSGVFCCRCGVGSLLGLLLRSLCIFLLFRGMCSWRAADIVSGKKGEKRSYGAKLSLSRNMNLEFEVRRMKMNENHGAEPVARANDPICHVPCSEPHGPRQLGSRLIFNVRHIGRFRTGVRISRPHRREREMKVGDSNHIQTASVEATGRSLLISLESEPFRTCEIASNRFQTIQTTKPSAAYISSSRMNTSPNHALEPTALLVTPRAFARVAPSSAVAHL